MCCAAGSPSISECPTLKKEPTIYSQVSLNPFGLLEKSRAPLNPSLPCL